jgi:hypothetical protein
VACTRETTAHDRLAVAPSGKLAGASPEKAFSSYDAPFATWIGLGGREEWHEAHQGVVGDGGAPEGTCTKEGQTGDQALAGEGVAASVWCFWTSGRRPGDLVSATGKIGG